MRRQHPLLVAVALAGLLAPPAANAAWPTSSSVNVPICANHDLLDTSALCTDGQGGVIAFTSNAPSPYGPPFSRGIRAHRLLANGVLDARWPVDGLLACSAAHTASAAYSAADGLGGAFVAWTDIRSNEYRLYAQHVLENGVVDPAWPDTGLSFCPTALAPYGLSAASDGAGGLFVWWQDMRDPDSLGIPILLQRLLPSGAVHPGWPAAGLAITSGFEGTWPLRLVPDGAGGALLAWNRRSDYPMGAALQHVLASGAVDPAWSTAGAATFTDSAVVFSYLAAASDKAGGMLVAWVDLRDSDSTRIYAMRFGADGQPHPSWPTGGRLVLASSDLPFTGGAGYQAPFVCDDGAGGLIITWQDGRTHLGWDLYAHHVLANGALDARWAEQGCAVNTTHSGQDYPSLRPDGAGGAYVGWADSRSGTYYETFLQRVLANGTIDGGWPQDGRPVSTGPIFHGDPVVLPTTPPGALLAWPDFRAGQYGAYAQRVNPDGSLGDAVASVASPPVAGTFMFAAPFPNPTANEAVLHFTLARENRIRLDILDAAGRRVRSLVAGMQSAGDHALRWDLLDGSGAPVKPGWYVALLEGAGIRESRPLIVRR